MGWAKFDDKRHTSAKLAAAGLAANGLDANGITWCAANETDGFVEDGALLFIAPGITRRQARTLAETLVNVGRWTRDDTRGGWWIKNYLRYNFSREHLEDKRERERERKAKFRPDSARNPRHGDTNSEHPVPTRPDPSRPDTSSSSSEEPFASPPPADEDDPAIHVIVEWKRRISDVRNYAGWHPVVLSDVRFQHAAAIRAVRFEHPDWPDEQVAAKVAPDLEPMRSKITRIGREAS